MTVAEPPMPTPEVDLEALKFQDQPPTTTKRRRNRRNAAEAFSEAGSVVGNDEDKNPIEQIREAGENVAKAAQKGAARKTKPTDDNWFDLLSVVVGYVALLAVWWLTAGSGISSQERSELEPNDEETESIARPLSRILARSSLNAKYGHNAMGFADYILLAAALTMYTQRLAPRVQAKVKDARARNAEKRPKKSVVNMHAHNPQENNVTQNAPDEPTVNNGPNILGLNQT